MESGSALARAALRKISGEIDRVDQSIPARRIVFGYLVPVHVEVEDGLVTSVTVIDDTPVRDPVVVRGGADDLAAAVAAANNGQAWPSWRFGD